MAGIEVCLSVDHAIYTQAHRGFGGVCVWLAVSGRVGVPALAFIRGIGLPGCSCPQGRRGHVDTTNGTDEIMEQCRPGTYCLKVPVGRTLTPLNFEIGNQSLKVLFSKT